MLFMRKSRHTCSATCRNSVDGWIELTLLADTNEAFIGLPKSSPSGRRRAFVIGVAHCNTFEVIYEWGGPASFLPLDKERPLHSPRINKELPNVTVRGQQTGYSNGDKLFSGAMTWMHLVASDGIA